VTLRLLFGKYCVAERCMVERDPAHLLCPQHWAMVAPDVQEQVIRAIGRYQREPTDQHKWLLLDAADASRICIEDEEHDD
jgi:hypothetical protein